MDRSAPAERICDRGAHAIGVDTTTHFSAFVAILRRRLARVVLPSLASRMWQRPLTRRYAPTSPRKRGEGTRLLLRVAHVSAGVLHTIESLLPVGSRK